MIDISKSFETSSETVSDFYQRPGLACYIPRYQREYSWDLENIDQLMDDIINGVEDLMNDEKLIHFMGSLILVREKNPKVNIDPKDIRALPESIVNVIDGQQRISTISLLSCLLFQRLHDLRKKLTTESLFDGLREAIDVTSGILLELISVDIRRGTPKKKPFIIRASVDGWTFDGKDDDNYQSVVSGYLAKFIRAVDEKEAFPKIPPSSNLVGKNLRKMNTLLNCIENSHEKTDNGYPPAWKILEKIKEEYLWTYSRPELVELINSRHDPLTADEKVVCSLIQLFSFTHFLLQRCCFTLIIPTSDESAFDMFQSLNATGTPLTAIETFKPLVVSHVESSKSRFKGSKSEDYFENIDSLFGNLKTAASKSRMTNEFLTTYALQRSGEKISSQFSRQRRWLEKKYSGLKSNEEREEFVRQMGDLSCYWVDVLQFNPSQAIAISGTNEEPDKEKKLGALCALYLKDAGHKMANTILGRFYAHVNRKEEDAPKEFLEICKVVASFFTIWRSALPNAGLDDVYRTLLRGDEKKRVPRLSWEGKRTDLQLSYLKKYFKQILEKKEIASKESWKKRSLQYFRYNHANVVCRFALFVTAHDTIIDVDNPGLMKVGTEGTHPFLGPENWISDHFKSIEHIAPQKPKDKERWDSDLFENDNFQLIGNLTLLPLEINISAGNSGWVQKYIYYRHLSEEDPNNLDELAKLSKDMGVHLQSQTVELLKRTPYKHHINPIVEVGEKGPWNLELVNKRTERICDILWDRIYGWLN